MAQAPFISVVLSVYNEENAIGVLLREIGDVFASAIDRSYEVIVVDDASLDRSVEAACGVAVEQRHALPLRILTSDRRSGQSAALMRGMTAATGELIVTMDADL
ncbi:MAG: glycosyltransferase family 2 protein, partial [Chitinispirillaceae bacterium]|nr:glycosyltransferase family 2 protein [Chitinispirillaceae bacterium]